MKKLLPLLILSLAATVAMPAFAAGTDAKGTEAKSSKMAECNAKTKGMSKDEAAKARSECMKAKPAAKPSSSSKMAECNAKTKGMSKADAAKARSECMKAT
ncbi:MAG TPA: phosphate starvation-inducible protein PsiF [Casimicrobiaceae bacterium]